MQPAISINVLNASLDLQGVGSLERQKTEDSLHRCCCYQLKKEILEEIYLTGDMDGTEILLLLSS